MPGWFMLERWEICTREVFLVGREVVCAGVDLCQGGQLYYGGRICAMNRGDLRWGHVVARKGGICAWE